MMLFYSHFVGLFYFWWTILVLVFHSVMCYSPAGLGSNSTASCPPRDPPSDNLWNLIYLATKVLSDYWIYRRYTNKTYLSIYLSNVLWHLTQSAVPLWWRSASWMPRCRIHRVRRCMLHATKQTTNTEKSLNTSVLITAWDVLCTKPRVPTLLVTKNSRTPEAFSQDPVVSQQCLNIETNSSY